MDISQDNKLENESKSLYGVILTQEDYINRTWQINNLLIDIIEYFVQDGYKVFIPLFNDINNSSLNGLKDIFTKFYIFYKGYYIEIGWKLDIMNIFPITNHYQNTIFYIRLCETVMFNLPLPDENNCIIIKDSNTLKEFCCSRITELLNFDKEDCLLSQKPNFVVQINSLPELQKLKFNR